MTKAGQDRAHASAVLASHARACAPYDGSWKASPIELDLGRDEPIEHEGASVDAVVAASGYARSAEIFSAPPQASARRLSRLRLMISALIVEGLGIALLLGWLSSGHPFVIVPAVFGAVPFLLFATDLNISALALFTPREQAPLDRLEESNGAPNAIVPVAVPVLVRSIGDVEAAASCLIENLERRDAAYVEYVLLVDFCDAGTAEMPDDTLLRQLLEDRVKALSEERRSSGAAPFHIFYRKRRWNEFDGLWMGWERKRGKVVEFLSFIRGSSTSYEGACPSHWKSAQFIFVIDVDTRVRGGDIARMVPLFEQRRAASSGGRPPAVMSPYLETLDQPREPLARWLSEPKVFAGTYDWRELTLRQRVFGADLYNGKGLIAIDDFIALSMNFEDNTILSHDHLEAILGTACSTNVASVHEPFPASRASWERRQHRWVRGDFQVLPWIFAQGERTPGSFDWGDRFAVSHIILNALNPIAAYACVLACFALDSTTGIVATALLVLMQRDSFILAMAQLPLFVFRGAHSNGALRSAMYLATNGALRSLGTFIYFQRNALISFDAMNLSLIRLARPGRAGLLEWYPIDPHRSIRMRSSYELIVIVVAAMLRATGVMKAGFLELTCLWLVVPWLIDRWELRYPAR